MSEKIPYRVFQTMDHWCLDWQEHLESELCEIAFDFCGDKKAIRIIDERIAACRYRQSLLKAAIAAAEKHITP